MPKKAAKKKKTPTYQVALTFDGGETHEGGGDTFVDAVFAAKPPLVKGKGTISVTKDGETTETVWPANMVRRLFASENNARILAKRLGA